MKKQILSALLLLMATVNLNAQSRDEVDQALNKFQSQYNNKQYSDIYRNFSDRITKQINEDMIKKTMAQQFDQFGDLKSYSHVKEEGQFSYYKVVFSKTTQTLVMSLDEAKKIEVFRFVPYTPDGAPRVQSNFVYESPNGKIYGSLEMPDAKKPVPVVLMVAGSGPTDRNCNQQGMETNTFKMIADSLRKAGIASVRYDKRGVGESAAALNDESKLVFDDMVKDAAGFIKMLKADKRFSHVIVMGHSEGSLVGMIAAARENAAAYVSVAGLGERADKIIVRQIAAQSEELSLKAAFMLDSMQKGNTVQNVDPALQSLFRPSVQPYIKSWIKYDPQEEIKKLSCPVLVLQGTTDLQVPTEEADLLKAAYPKATLKIVDGMNHVLKAAPADRAANIATYTQPGLPVSKDATTALVSFVNTVSAAK